jgi:hypothetical protein
MENFIDAIRAATADNATPEARVAGAQACRNILAALEAKLGQPLAAASSPSSSMQALLAALGNTPPDQLLDLAIAKLRTLMPAAQSEPQTVQSVRIPLVPISIKGGGS